MSVWELLERAKANGLAVSLEGGKLKVRAPQEPRGETRALVEELRQHKAKILEALAEDDPILTPDEWTSEFSRFCVQVYRSTPDLDWK